MTPWLILHMVGMGIGAGSVSTQAGIWFTLGGEQLHFTLMPEPDITSDDQRTEFTIGE